VIKTRRFLVGAAAVAACALVASGCDTSPVAAGVNGQNIKQTKLNQEVRAYAENGPYVASFTQQNSSTGASIHGVAAGTYSTAFVDLVLSQEIKAAAIHQFLVTHHSLPGPGLQAAARGLESALVGQTEWLGFPAWYRAELAQQAAEEAELYPVPSNLTTIRSTVAKVSAYLFSQVCVRQVAFARDNASGQVDYPASLAAASAALAADPHLAGGAVTCYGPTQLEAQGSPLYQTVLSLGVGKVTKPVKTTFGYQVYALVSREELPLDANLKRATAFILDEVNDEQSSIEKAVFTGAKVHINPQYGTWSKASASVTPPKAPAS
jgi:hypothetical protein